MTRLRSAALVGTALLAIMVMASDRDANESIGRLANYRWEHRLVLAMFETEGDVERFVAAMPGSAPLKDRRMLVLLIEPEGKGRRVFPDGRSEPMESSLAAEVRLELERGGGAALIGLDGGVKQRYELRDFEWADIFARIDRMPMRLRELRQGE